MTATAKAPDAGWARLSAGIIHDPDWLGLNAAGRLVFMTGIALAKAANRDGELSLRAMTGVMVGALTAKQVQRAASDLVDAGLWGEASHPDRYVVTGFLRWNESTSDQEARRARKVTGAHRTNHQLGRHTTPEPDCPDCTKRDATANAKATGPPNGAAVAGDRSDKTLTRRDVDESSTSSHGSAARPPAPDDDDELAAPDEGSSLARELLELAGLARPRPTMGELRTVARLAAGGWTPDQLRTMATRASLADVDPRAYLAKMLAEALNSDPDDTRHHVDNRRPLLDDERPPCSTCNATLWVDQDDGTVAPCPTCAQIGAPP